jgi:serine palmitoyltransferase
VDELVQDWQPEPLIPNQTAYDQFNLSTLPVIEDGQGAKAKVVGYSKPLMNLATSNFLNLASADRIHAKAIETLKKYGVGTCGPRGFYGTIDVHMDLERDISRFLGTEDTILYAQDYAAISSVIPAFSKRGDYIVW